MTEVVPSAQCSPRVWICSYLPASGGRGIERVVDMLSSSLRKYGYEVRVVDAEAAGIMDSPLVSIRPYAAWRIGRLVNSLAQRDDIIICNSYFSWNARKRRSLVIYHQTERERAISNKGRRGVLRNITVMTIGSWFDGKCGSGRMIVAVSNAVKDEIEKHYRLKVDAVITDGVDLAEFSPAGDKKALRNALSLPENDFLVVHAGPSDMQKGLGLVIKEILPRVRDTQHLILLTNTSERPKGSTVVGRVGFEKMAAYLRSCDALLMPSVYEGFGLTVAEALACGVPPLVTPTGIGRDLARDSILGRYVIPFERPDEYAACLKRLQEDRKEHEAASRAARVYAERNLSTDRFARSYIELIRSLK